jgi:hypothetical protein
MDQRLEILNVMSMLSEYYGHEPSKGQVGIYLRALADVHPAALRDAAYAWIQQSPFYPRVNELRRLAAYYAPESNYRLQELYALQDVFFQQGRLELDEWETLEEHFKRADRPNMAEYVKVKYERLVAIQQGLIGDEQVERYGQWVKRFKVAG